MDTKKYYIYALCNRINSKVYIGQTSDPAHRFQVKQYRGKKIADAIREIGWSNFYAVALAMTKSKDRANKLEFDYIVKYDSVNNGYNSTYGTKYVGNKHRTEATRAQQSATMSSTKWYWNPDTDETVRIVDGMKIPEGFVRGRGGKMKSVRGHSLWRKTKIA